jgi:hypothetical protein
MRAAMGVQLMSQTIALLTELLPERRANLSALAEEFGFSLQAGFANCSPLTKNGIMGFWEKGAPGTDVLFFTRGEDDAWFIQEELVNYRLKGDTPRIFEFLRMLGKMFRFDSSSSYLISAEEWGADENALFFSGNIEQLISLLSLTKSLDAPMWIPGTGRIQEEGRPIVFEIPANKS